MASTLPTTGAQGPVLFEDLAVYFSQEECVSLHPAQRSLSRDTAQECFMDNALMGEGKIEINQQLSLESMGLEELALEKYSITVPLVYCPEKSSEHGVGNLERKISGGTSACKKRLISLLVTIENHTPLVELSQCLGTSTLSEIFEFPGGEATNSYKCPECNQSFSDSSYLVLHQKMHSGEKKYNCGDCGKMFNHRANLRTHRRIHTGEKPYKCAECSSTFRQHSHLSRHMNVHGKEKPYTCGTCGRGFLWLPGLAQHQKTHAAKKAHGKYLGQQTNLALPEKRQASAPQHLHSPGRNCSLQPALPALPEKGHEDSAEHCSDYGGNMLSFSKFKPFKCPECPLTCLHLSELISHQSTHRREKAQTCKTPAESFLSASEPAHHWKSHTGENPLKCTVCGKHFRLKTHLTAHERTHLRNAM
ncbi:zinc finger protein 597 isoform X1 [Vicugna pacos]|uniref:Zinc finger protein 597 isoform X1 n=1 Tax=Vicugna pacos TaxID=30538 RepID=A0A6I9I692_VICPA